MPMRAIVPAVLCALIVATTVARGEELANDDVRISLEPREGGIAIASLRAAGSQFEWIASQASPRMVPFIDHVVKDGRNVPVRWKPIRSELRTPRDGTAMFRFHCDDPPMTLESFWQLFPGLGPVEHHVRIRNEGQGPVLVPRQTSLALTSVAGPSTTYWWVEKGGSWPMPVGIHEDRITSQTALKLKSGPLAGDNPRDPIPFIAVRSSHQNVGWYAGIEFSGRVMMQLAGRDVKGTTVLDTDFGLEPKEDLVTHIAPGQTYEPPVAFIGCFRGDMDDCGNHFRKWVAEHLRPPVHEPDYPLLVNNSWGSGMAVDEKLARSMIDQSVELGLEMFHIDAGWFRTVGDWRANPAKFPHGLRPVSDYAHEKGLKFGLWVGWTQAGNANPADDPKHILSVKDKSRADWFPEDYPADWKPNEFSGATVCLADPRAEQWCLNLLRDLVKENRLDLLEHDQRMIVDNCPRADHEHTKARVDVAFRAGEAYYRVYDALRRDNPDLLFEDCVNGGQMVDFGVIRRVHYISITDIYDPLSNRKAFYDSSYLIPPAMCECYVDQHPGRTLANFVYMLRSGMMGWCTIMLDTKQWTPEQHALAKRQLQIYKTKLRSLIRSADLYHVSDRPDGVHWDGIQYFDPSTGAGVLFAFRGKNNDAEHTFVLKGLDPKTEYVVSFEDGIGPEITARGDDLLRTGVPVRLPEPESSSLVYLRKSQSQ